MRIAHLGLGAFHRAHQAWWTGAVSQDDPWGIAAFTGRGPAAATVLAGQDGLFTLLVRAPDGDEAHVVSSISRAVDGSDTAAFTGCLADPAVGILTLTVTEAGYCRGADGRIDLTHPAIAADRQRLLAGLDTAEPLRSAPGRVVAGLLARRRADAGPLAIVPCDNLTDNGGVSRSVIRDFAETVDPGLTDWIADSVAFVSTAVDRITPRTHADDLVAAAARTGWDDQAPVVTEPFREWVLAGDFPAGRPAWQDAGARFVDDVTPFEERKLWLLNGAHSILAYGGLGRGHSTVVQAIADDTCRRWVEEWWVEASAHLGQPQGQLREYRAQLLLRFQNPRIRHLLSQIAMDGSQKLRMRAIPVLRRELAAGRRGEAALRMLACWIAYVRASPADLTDPLADSLRQAARAPWREACRGLLSVLDAELAENDGVIADLDSMGV
ncbi:mannitol dehydrogenase family protein [Streptomyces sp. NPDC102274]|uniref:mannitol dehydrogenase family protein n=1 Tax=Streptomyces sp. NPDC102274 TaxID=3366151 RepID=UPI0038237CD0